MAGALAGIEEREKLVFKELSSLFSLFSSFGLGAAAGGEQCGIVLQRYLFADDRAKRPSLLALEGGM